MKSSQVDSAVDVICNRGCRYVNAVINDSSAQQSCQELLSLNNTEKVVVIEELRSVMSVYDQTGSCES